MPTADSRGRQGRLSDHFGSAPYFTFVDDQSGAVEVLPNHHAHHQRGTCQPAKGLAGHHVDAVVCLGLGRRALGGLEHAGIEVFVTDATDVDGAIEAFRAGRVVTLTPEAACGGGRGTHCD
jgi:predicted Fe-Mo cluster-binding NifX family protein